MLNSVFAPRKKWVKLERVVGAVLRRERLLKGLSLPEVSKLSKVHESYIQRFEKAIISIPAVNMLRVAQALGLGPAALGMEIEAAIKHLETLDIIVVDTVPVMGDPLFGYPQYEDETQTVPEEEEEEQPA